MRLVMNLSPIMKGYTYPEMFQLFSEAGFDAIDFMLNDLTKDDSPMSGDGYRDYALEVRRAAEACGLAIAQTHAPFQFKNWADEAHFNGVILPRTIRALEMSALMGARVCVVHGLQYIPYADNAEKLFEMNMDFYRTLLPYAEEYGVKIGIENLWQRDPLRKCIVRSICASSEEHIRYVDTLNSPYAVACVDVGHSGLVVGGEPAQAVIRALGTRVGALHIHDNDYQTDSHVMPYTGKLNWKEIIAALAEIGYDGDFTFEVGDGLFTGADESFHAVGAGILHTVGRHLIAQIEKGKGSI